jgi:hypothetical protein
VIGPCRLRRQQEGDQESREESGAGHRVIIMGA